jgi:malate dehydrogenase
LIGMGEGRRAGAEPERLRVAFAGGAGTVGSTAAFRVAQLGVASEILLLDTRQNMVESHVMDLEQAAATLGTTRVAAAGWDDLHSCDVVVLSASLPERNVSSRDEYLGGNAAIVAEAARRIGQTCPQAVVVVATNPVDVFTYLTAELGGLPARQVVGYSWNDSLRLRWAVAGVLGVPAAEVSAWVLGEHGEAQVPLFDRVRVGSRPVALSGEQRERAEAAVRGWFSRYQALQSGRTSGWTSAVGIGEVVSALAGVGADCLPCSAVLAGEYGLSGVSLGVPARLDGNGVREVVEFDLAQEDLERLHEAAAKVRASIDRALTLVGQ